MTVRSPPSPYLSRFQRQWEKRVEKRKRDLFPFFSLREIENRRRWQGKGVLEKGIKMRAWAIRPQCCKVSVRESSPSAAIAAAVAVFALLISHALIAKHEPHPAAKPPTTATKSKIANERHDGAE